MVKVVLVVDLCGCSCSLKRAVQCGHNCQCRYGGAVVVGVVVGSVHVLLQPDAAMRGWYNHTCQAPSVAVLALQRKHSCACSSCCAMG